MIITRVIPFVALSIAQLLSSIANAQAIYSKDGVYLFDGELFMQSCIQGAKESMMNIHGITLDIESYCQCCRENAFQQLTSKEIKVAFEKDQLKDLLEREDVLLAISKCAQSKFEIAGDFKANQSNNRTLTIKSFTAHCLDDLKNSPEFGYIWTEETTREFCTCKAEKIYDGEYDFNALSEINSTSSLAYNEVFLACLPDEVVKRMNAFKNSYRPNNIIGKRSEIAIDLLKDVNGIFKVKLTIGGNSSYFYLDTGASDLILTKDLYNKYEANGNIHASDFLGYKQYQMADGNFINAEMYTLHNIKIGDFLVKETKVGVVESGLPLLGTGFLANFKDWEVSKENKTLILRK
jgi:clan AA aspartic protease (TIGR02281 family)